MPLACSPAGRRYQVRLLVVMAVYFAVLFPVDWLFRHHAPAGAVKYLLAAAPGLPIVAVFVVMGVYLAEERDEFIRAKVVQAILWGAALALSAATVWGFLENFAEAPRIPMFLVFPVFCVGMAAGQIFNRWRYR